MCNENKGAICRAQGHVTFIIVGRLRQEGWTFKCILLRKVQKQISQPNKTQQDKKDHFSKPLAGSLALVFACALWKPTGWPGVRVHSSWGAWELLQVTYLPRT